MVSRRSSAHSSCCCSSSSIVLPKRLWRYSTDIDTPTDVNENLRWCKSSSDPWVLVVENWNITTNARLKTISSKDGQSISKYMSEFPTLKKPPGYLLVNIHNCAQN